MSPWLETQLKRLLLVIGVGIVVIALVSILLRVAMFAAYGHFFKVLVSHGGLNSFVAKAFSLIFAFCIYRGLRLWFSFKKEDQTNGELVLVTTVVAFHLLVFICNPSAPSVVPDERFFTATGEAKVSVHVDPQTGEWELFPVDTNFHPRTGRPTKPMTPELSEQYDEWLANNPRPSPDIRNHQRAGNSTKDALSSQEQKRKESMEALMEASLKSIEAKMQLNPDTEQPPSFPGIPDQTRVLIDGQEAVVVPGHPGDREATLRTIESLREEGRKVEILP